MTYAEYEKKIDDILAKPESIGIGLAEIRDEIKKDLEAGETHKARADSLQDNLNKANWLLFQRETGKPEHTAETENEDWAEMKGIEAVDAYIKAHEKRGEK